MVVIEDDAVDLLSELLINGVDGGQVSAGLVLQQGGQLQVTCEHVKINFFHHIMVLICRRKAATLSARLSVMTVCSLR